MHLPIGQLEEMTDEMRTSMFAKIKMFKSFEVMLYNTEKNEIITDETLMVVKKILKVIPDYYPGWNILKIYCKNSGLDMDGLLSQLEFNEGCFKVKQKSYPTFFHRKWLLKEYPQLFNYEREQNLIEYILEKDPRNFHAWDYKAYLSAISVDHQIDLEFSSKMIKRNVYNSGAFNFKTQTIRKMENLDWDLLKGEFEFFIEVLVMDSNNECLYYYLGFITDKYLDLKEEMKITYNEEIEDVVNEIKEVISEIEGLEGENNKWIPRYKEILEHMN
eukprot:GAHX01001670.1.p1 GENE.GAHX01001670.1~~GAHX01001670.1.p1  ORF type:complete len:274 (-),score=60.32 GAHX01001670.1:179-1000(-)